MTEDQLYDMFSDWYELCLLNGVEPEKIVERMGGMTLVTENE